MRTCIDCKESKPLTEFYKRPNYNKSGREYHNSVCKKCYGITKADKYTRHREDPEHWHLRKRKK